MYGWNTVLRMRRAQLKKLDAKTTLSWLLNFNKQNSIQIICRSNRTIKSKIKQHFMRVKSVTEWHMELYFKQHLWLVYKKPHITCLHIIQTCFNQCIPRLPSSNTGLLALYACQLSWTKLWLAHIKTRKLSIKTNHVRTRYCRLYLTAQPPTQHDVVTPHYCSSLWEVRLRLVQIGDIHRKAEPHIWIYKNFTTYMFHPHYWKMKEVERLKLA